jgi:ketosteroid isomerase-like protein
MSERDDFLGWVGSRLKDAEVALHNGDAAPRFAIWSTKDPVTVLGAWKSGGGPQAVGDIFRDLEACSSDCTSYSHEVVAADVHGDMAYTVGYEHTQGSINGIPQQYTLRVTQVYRREDGEWKVAHRHADRLAQPEQSAQP